MILEKNLKASLGNKTMSDMAKYSSEQKRHYCTGCGKKMYQKYLLRLDKTRFKKWRWICVFCWCEKTQGTYGAFWNKVKQQKDKSLRILRLG